MLNDFFVDHGRFALANTTRTPESDLVLYQTQQAESGSTMFFQPTPDDFAARIDWHLTKAVSSGEKAITSIERKANAEGWYRTGTRIQRVIDIAHAEFQSGVDVALGELKRAMRTDELEKWELRRITHERLKEFAAQIKVVTKPEKLKELGSSGAIDQRLSEIDEQLMVLLRQFDVGLYDPAIPEEPKVTNNSIQVETMTGGAIQLGTQSSSQNVGSIDLSSTLRALKDLENELAEQCSDPSISELRADLATIKAQLAKTAPSRLILTESAKSLRNVAEGVIAGATTNRVVQLTSDLLRALGLN